MPLVAIVLAGILVIAMGWHRALSIEALIKHRTVLEGFISRHFILALFGFIGVYVAAVALSLPGAVLLTITAGILFGCFVGGLAAIVAATTGAMLIFLLARSALHDTMQRKAGPRLAKLAKGFQQDAFSYLLSLRLVPIFPFWLVNLAAAVLGVRLGVFVSATVLGIVPATIAFACIGSGLDSVLAAQETAYKACLASGRSGGCRPEFDLKTIVTPQILMALTALGALALIPALVRRWRAHQASGR